MKRVAIITSNTIVDEALVKLYLNEEYDVKVSTQDISNKGFYEHLMELPNADRLHIEELNLNKPDGIVEFTKDCDYIVFCANEEFTLNHALRINA